MSQFKEIISHNTIANSSKSTLILRYFINSLRTFYMLKFKYRWIISKGFLRIPIATKIWSPNKLITFGHKVQIGPNCIIQCDLEIGNEVLVASNVSFIGRNDHTYNIIGTSIWNSPRGTNLKTIIGNDCWIGHGVTILAGVRIAEGSIIAAGSLVITDVEQYSIYAGVPAKKIKTRFVSEADLKNHLKIYQFTNGK